MVDTNKSLIVIVLDRSGSMESIRDDTIGGINTFLKDQRAAPGECNVTLVQFDDKYEIVYQNTPISKVPDLTPLTFVPRGATALLDAIGRTINATGAQLALLPEEVRPGKIFFIISTDGFENASKEFTDKKQVFEMIKHQEEKYNWQFVFLGAEQDAIAAGENLGIAGTQSLSYKGTSRGISGTYKALSNKIIGSRMTGQKVEFDLKDRQDASQ